MRKTSLKYIIVADRRKAHILGEGEVTIQLENGTKVKLLNVLFVPDITVNLVSVSEASKRNLDTIFSEKKKKKKKILAYYPLRAIVMHYSK